LRAPRRSQPSRRYFSAEVVIAQGSRSILPSARTSARIAARRVMGPARHQQTLIAIGQTEDTRAKIGPCFHVSGRQTPCIEAQSETRGTTRDHLRRHQPRPARWQSAVGVQHQQPFACALCHPAPQLPPARRRASYDHRPRLLGYDTGGILRAAIAYDHFADEARLYAFEQRAQASGQLVPGMTAGSNPSQRITAGTPRAGFQAI